MEIFRKALLLSVLSAVLAAYFSSPAWTAMEKYKLQPMDVLKISVHEQPDLDTKTRVAQDGFITFPLVGRVYAAGLTAQDLENKLKELLEADYLVQAEVLVFIEEYHPRQFSAIGELNSPGKFEMPQEKELTYLEAVAMAGGFTKDAKLTNTTVIRVEDGQEKMIRINANDIIERAEKQKNILIMPGDIIIAPKSFWQVSVIGEVKSPGKFDMPKERSMTLLEAIAMAGGFTEDAKIDDTTIMRVKDGVKETIKVNVREITDKGMKGNDVTLEPDDIVYVPESFF